MSGLVVEKEILGMQPSRKRAAVAALLYHYCAAALMIVQGFMLVPLYLKHVGIAEYGAWLATGSVVSWLGVVDPGSQSIVQQRISRAYGERRRSLVAETVGSGLALSVFFSACIVVLTFAVAPLIPSIVNGEARLAATLTVAFILAGVGEGILQTGLAFGGVLLALMIRGFAVGIVYSVATVAGIGIIILLLVQGHGIVSIPVGMLVRACIVLLGNVVLFAQAMAQWHIRPTVSKQELREAAHLSAFVWTAKVSQAVLGNLDSLLVMRFIGPAAVTLLSVARKGGDVLATVTTRIGAAVSPGLAHLAGEGRREKLAFEAARLLRVTGLVSTVGICGYTALSSPFVTLWVRVMTPGQTLVLGLAGALAWQCIGGILGTVQFATGDIKRFSVTVTGEMILRIGLMAGMLAMGLGVLSVPIAFLTAGMLFSLRRYLKAIDVASGEWATLVRSATRSLLMQLVVGICLAYGWARLAPVPRGWPHLIVQVAAVGITSSLALLALSPELRSTVTSFQSVRRVIGSWGLRSPKG